MCIRHGPRVTVSTAFRAGPDALCIAEIQTFVSRTICVCTGQGKNGMKEKRPPLQPTGGETSALGCTRQKQQLDLR